MTPDIMKRWSTALIVAAMLTVACGSGFAQDGPGTESFAAGVEYYENNQLEQARDAFEAALQERPDDPTVLVWLGSVSLQLGDTEAAIEH
ncbi:MAG: tetratricopeptide repeat protein, partial [Armatimonadota bacterium]